MRTPIRIGVSLLATPFVALLALPGCGGTANIDIARPAFEVDRARFGELDRDSSDSLDEEELYCATEGYYDAFDMDQDGRLSDRELADGLFLAWDRDQNDRLSEPELEQGAVAWFPSSIEVRFGDWDVNHDLIVDRAELHDGLIREHVFSTWDGDGDGDVTDLELTASLFHDWDMDHSDSIDALEYRFD